MSFAKKSGAREVDVRIVVADHNTEVRSALLLLLRESRESGGGPEATCHSVLEAADAPALIRQLESEPSDVVLLDWELPGLAPRELVAEIKRLSPACRIVAMSGHPEARSRSLGLGATGFVSKNEPPDRLLELLHLTLADLGD